MGMWMGGNGNRFSGINGNGIEVAVRRVLGEAMLGRICGKGAFWAWSEKKSMINGESGDGIDEPGWVE